MKALILDDDPSQLAALAELVEAEGFEVKRAETLEKARLELLRELPDVVISDVMLPDGRGLELLEELADEPDTEVILVTGKASVETAVEALRLGAHDYLTKPIDVARLLSLLAGVTRTRELKREVTSLRDELRRLGRFGPLVGQSTAMQGVYDYVTRVAPTDTTVLVVGESGTGKELVAQAIHSLSRRRDEPFIPLNCGAISASLIESELFGHERGSFTGASRQHRGHFERASGGTLFLDEITEMPIELQVKLLRVLETRQILRVGGVEPIDVDVRVLSATNRRPEEAVAEGKLREDLYYRLKVFPINLPPLTEREGDVKLLAEHFLGILNEREGGGKSLSPDALAELDCYEWPGNVRQLKHVIERAFILADDELEPENLALEGLVRERGPAGPKLTVRLGQSIAEAEKKLILATLAHHDGAKPRTAEVLGISLKTLYNRLNSYDDPS